MNYIKALTVKYEFNKELRLRRNDKSVVESILKINASKKSIFSGVGAKQNEDGQIIFKPNFALSLGGKNELIGEIDLDKSLLRIRVRLPMMIYLGTFLSIIGTLFMLFDEGEKSPILLVVPIMPFWFYYIYRMQCNSQFSNIKNRLVEIGCVYP